MGLPLISPNCNALIQPFPIAGEIYGESLLIDKPLTYGYVYLRLF
jgi:hypothetical protein